MSTAKNVVVDQVDVATADQVAAPTDQVAAPTDQAVAIAEKKPRGRKPKALETKTDVETKIAEPKTDVEKKTVEKKPRQKKEPVAKVQGEGEGEESKVDGQGESKEKKPKKPTLPAKFAKFIQFGLFLMKELNDERLIAGETPLVDETVMLEKLCVFADVDLQKGFVQKFFDGAKDTAKTMRKMIADKKKADNKKDKVKKPRQKKNHDNDNDNTDAIVDEIPKKEKKPRQKKVKNEPDLVAELVSLATTDNTLPVNTLPDTAHTDTKPKRKYTKKNNSTNTIPHNHNDNNHNDNETEVDIIVIDGKQFLCDDQSRVFDFLSHKPLGKLIDGLLVTL